MANPTCPTCGGPTVSLDGEDRCPFCSVRDAPAAHGRADVQAFPLPGVPASAAPTRVPRDTPCPRCGAPLLDGRAGTVVLLGCHGCGGVWIDGETVRALATQRDKDAEELARAMGSKRKIEALLAVDRDKPVHCPACHALLRREVVGAQATPVDVCDAHGTWFDWGELSMLFAPGPTPEPLSEAELEAAGIPGDANQEPGFFTVLFRGLLSGGRGRRRLF